MHPLNINLAQMTQETFEYEGSRLKDDSSNTSSPGLIYYLEEGKNSFSIKGFPTHNIREKLAKLDNIDQDNDFKKILSGKRNLPEIFFFQTNSFELAEILKDQMTGRRFVHQEEFLLNLSIPGFEWWMRGHSTGFKIYFCCPSHFDKDKRLIKLGPIGDAKVASLRLNESRELLQSFFPIEEFVCNDREFHIVTKNPFYLNFTLLKNIFLRGENPTLLEHYPDNSMGHTLFHYFHEIATARKFWMRIEEHIHTDKLF